MTNTMYQERRKLVSGLKLFFGVVNNGTNTSKLTTANLSKITLCDSFKHPSINCVPERETPTSAYAIRSAEKMTVPTPFGANFSMRVFSKS